MNSQRLKAGQSTGYYGANGGIMPIFSCGAQPLAPSFLTGNGSHLNLWVSVVIHVAALALTITANAIFMSADRSQGLDLLWGWSLSSIIGHTLAVLGTLVATALIKDTLAAPLVNTLGCGMFLGALVATGKLSYSHSGLPADAAENVTLNLALFFQSFGLASLAANGLCAASKAGGI
jgi:hypothetical protein